MPSKRERLSFTAAEVELLSAIAPELAGETAGERARWLIKRSISEAATALLAGNVEAPIGGTLQGAVGVALASAAAGAGNLPERGLLQRVVRENRTGEPVTLIVDGDSVIEAGTGQPAIDRGDRWELFDGTEIPKGGAA